MRISPMVRHVWVGLWADLHPRADRTTQILTPAGVVCKQHVPSEFGTEHEITLKQSAQLIVRDNTPKEVGMGWRGGDGETQGGDKALTD